MINLFLAVNIFLNKDLRHITGQFRKLTKLLMNIGDFPRCFPYLKELFYNNQQLDGYIKNVNTTEDISSLNSV